MPVRYVLACRRLLLSDWNGHGDALDATRAETTLDINGGDR
jgi:hypothetical protein